MRIAREGIMARRMLQPVSSVVICGLAAFAAGCASPSHPRSPRPLLLTTDAGCEVDDQWALAYLLLAAEEGEIDLRGIVTTHAPNLKPPAAASSAAVAREVMAVLGPRNPPPVIPGASQPLEAQDRPRRGLGAEFIVEM